MLLDVLNHLFSAVCGQNPDHTWAPGGILLPCCQRCTGLYAGAAVVAAVYLWLRPRLSGRLLLVNGAFLLLMAPFGFHWVTHGPLLRTITGMLFGCGVVTYLWLPVNGAQKALGAGARTPRPRVPPKQPRADEASALLLFVAVFGAVLLLAAKGGQASACLLSGLATFGLVSLVCLVVANLALVLMSVTRWIWQLGRCPRKSGAGAEQQAIPVLTLACRGGDVSSRCFSACSNERGDETSPPLSYTIESKPE